LSKIKADMKTFIPFKFILISILFSVNIFPQQVNWAKQSATSTNENAAHHLSVDFSGNVFTTGWDYGGGYIFKYDSLGFILWTRHVQGALFYGGSTDNSGNTYITGNFSGTVAFGNFILNSIGTEYFLVKYDASGNCIWARRAGQALGKALKTDNNGYVYVTGDFSGSCTFGSTTITQTHSGIADNFVAKYDSLGQCLWVQQAIGSAYGRNCDISVNKKGDIFIMGNYMLPITFGSGADTMTISSVGNPIFIAKYNSTGSFKWAKIVSAGVGQCEGRGILVDEIGNYYITGWYDNNISFDNLSLTSSSNNGFIVKYDTMGIVKWATQPICNTGKAYGLAISKFNEVHITGIFETSGIYNTLVKFDSQGNEKWKEGYGATGNSNVISYGVYSDKDNHIYITGEFYGSIQFGVFNLNKTFNGSERAIFIVKVTDNNLTSVTRIEGNFSFQVYPNPTSRLITINITTINPKEEVMVTVNNSLGETVYSEVVKEISGSFTKQIDLSQLAKGIYFLELQPTLSGSSNNVTKNKVTKLVLQ